MKPTNADQNLPGKVLAEAIAVAAPPERIAEVLSQALAATITTRAGTVEPDTRSRLQAAAILLSYSVGTPIQRSEVLSVNLDADSSVGLKERLANSPALKKSLQSILDSVQS